MPLIDLPPGHVGAVVTFLEMTERPLPGPLPDSPLRLQRWRAPSPDGYRTLFRRVGGRWLWYSRLAMDDATLLANIGEVHAVIDRAGVEVGMIEFDRRQPGACLIRFLGLVPELAGKGHGSWLMQQLLLLAWSRDTHRVHLSTCSLDHPAALPFYLRAGFHATARAFESFPDPRTAGLLPADVAPQVPVTGSAVPRSAR